MLSKEFVLAGRAVFTAVNSKGERYTYRVRHKEATADYPEAWFASYLTGPDNTSDYSYIGKVDKGSGAVSLTAKSRLVETSRPLLVLRWLLKQVWEGKELPEGYAVFHMGKCGRCGRALTVPESIKNGIGPECIKHVNPVGVLA